MDEYLELRVHTSHPFLTDGCVVSGLEDIL